MNKLFTKTWDWIKSKWPWGRQQITVKPPEEIAPEEIVLTPIEPPLVRIAPPETAPAPVEVEPEFAVVHPLDLDTRGKRMSMMNLACPWRAVLPLGDGSFNQADRQIGLFLYAGILSGPPDDTPAPPATKTYMSPIMLFPRKRRSGQIL